MTRRNPPAKWVLPTVINPPKRRCFVIEVPDEPYHIAAFRGALLDLASAYKWADDTAHTAKDVALVWRAVIEAIQDCRTFTQPFGGADEGVEQMIRQNPDNPCLLETSIDGVNWCAFADLSLCVPQIGQPGAGAEQPRPGGGSACYDATLLASGQYLIPTLVSAGDVIEIQNASGAGSDGGGVFWKCPDGNNFVGGQCLSGTGTTSGGDPLPSVNHMRLLYKIGAIYYDAMGGPFTVPSGVAGAQVFIQVNDPSLSGNQGSYQFKVCVQNNSSLPATTATLTPTSHGALNRTTVQAGDVFVLSCSVGTPWFDGGFDSNIPVTIDIVDISGFTCAGGWGITPAGGTFTTHGCPVVYTPTSLVHLGFNGNPGWSITLRVASIP